MLTCLIVAGTLFVSGGPESTLRNFNFFSNLSLSRGGRTIWFENVSYDVPPHLVGQSAPRIMNDCAANATEDYVLDVSPKG